MKKVVTFIAYILLFGVVHYTTAATPCVTPLEDLVSTVNDTVWEFNEHSSLLPYKACQLKLRHVVESYYAHDPMLGDEFVKWINFTSRYVTFRLNHILDSTVVPDAHDLLEYQIVELINDQCQEGYCNDFHVVIEECGGKLEGENYIKSTYFTVHLLLFEYGMLKYPMCTQPCPEDSAMILDEILNSLFNMTLTEFIATNMHYVYITGYVTDFNFWYLFIALLVVILWTIVFGLVCTKCNKKYNNRVKKTI